MRIPRLLTDQTLCLTSSVVPSAIWTLGRRCRHSPIRRRAKCFHHKHHCSIQQPRKHLRTGTDRSLRNESMIRVLHARVWSHKVLLPRRPRTNFGRPNHINASIAGKCNHCLRVSSRTSYFSCSSDCQLVDLCSPRALLYHSSEKAFLCHETIGQLSLVFTRHLPRHRSQAKRHDCGKTLVVGNQSMSNSSPGDATSP